MDSVDYIIADIAIKENIDVDQIVVISGNRHETLKILTNLHEQNICDAPIDSEMSFDRDLTVFNWISTTFGARIKWYVGPTVLLIFPSLERKAEFLFKFG